METCLRRLVSLKIAQKAHDFARKTVASLQTLQLSLDFDESLSLSVTPSGFSSCAGAWRMAWMPKSIGVTKIWPTAPGVKGPRPSVSKQIE